MTTSAREMAPYTGEPYYLIEASRQYLRYRYTSADRVIEYSASDFAPIPMDVGKIVQKDQMTQNIVEVKVPADNPIAMLFRIAQPSETITFRIWIRHVGETDANLLWTGRIASVRWNADGWAVLLCEPTLASIKRNGLRIRYSRNCPYAMYDSECGLNRENFRVDGTLSSVNKTVVTSPQFATNPPGVLWGGFLEYETQTGIYERRSIVGHNGATISLNAVLPGLSVGAVVRAFWGCPQSVAACAQRGNVDNYGGCPAIPEINPMGNDPIY